MAGVAELACKSGYEVSGCDLQKSTFYSYQLGREIKVFDGHSPEHLKGVDLLVITPAIMFQNARNPEYLEAKKMGLVISWQGFLGKYLLKNKSVIAVSGTHGKSTTTAMAGLVLEEAERDPGVIVGAIVKKWNSSYRFGNGRNFIIEADEFNDNFLNYTTQTIIINNIEFDHPDFFKNETEVLNSFKKFVKKLENGGNLIVNQDSKGIVKLFKLLEGDGLKKIKVYGYTLNDKPLLKLDYSYKVEIKSLTEERSEFTVGGETYKLKIPGKHNIANAAGVIILAEINKIGKKVLKKALVNFGGTGRRMELLGKAGNTLVFDDYAHHPTAIKATLEAFKQKFPNERILVVYEPHSYSRTKALLAMYRGVFANADKVVIAPIFKARDKTNFGVSEESIVKVSNHQNIKGCLSFNEVKIEVLKNLKDGDVVVVMGAGKSYLLAIELLNSLSFHLRQKQNKELLLGENLSGHTTVNIGGEALFYIEVENEEGLIYWLKKARSYQIPYLVIGGGSNILVSDQGFGGLVIKNSCIGINVSGNKIIVKAGESLQNTINVAITAGLAGIEAMSWIPGTIGGAIRGNAGAYGQTISDHLMKVKIFDGEKVKWLSKNECVFSYRSSIFKKNSWVILEAEFEFLTGDKQKLRSKADEIIKIRKVKFPLDISCSGSFFKNIVASELPQRILSKIPRDKIVYDKISAGYLLEEVGAKGKSIGGVEISKSHANLVINKGKGSAKDFYTLTSEYKMKVEKEFGIKLFPEVELVGDFDYENKK